MKGTEKQIKWAEDIKEEAIRTCELNLNLYEGERSDYPHASETVASYRILKAFLIKAFETINDAAYIIDHREIYSSANVNSMARQFENDMISGRMTAEQIARKFKLTSY